MKMKIVVSAIMVISLATGGFAFGQGRNGRNEGNDRNDRNDRGQQMQRGNQQDNRGNDRRQQQRPMRQDNNAQRDERGAGPNHNFHRGDRLPPEYHNRQYVVDDWRGHNLSAPPRGYHWVQTGGDYVLVAIATGVILQLLLGH
jgi:Ni/Co efflux regulator RcnB